MRVEFSLPVPSVTHLLDHTDWRASPLGPPDSWPSAVRVLARQVLAARFPMWLAWGADLRMIYNDAYCAILGSKHPNSWAMPAREVWSEILDQIDPLFTSTLGGASTPLFLTTFDIVRGDHVEKVWFNFALTPVLGESGEVLGIFCAITENTSLLLAQETAELENRRLARAAAANAAERDRLWNLATEIMLVADYQSHIVAANPAWQAVLGWSVEDCIGTEFLHLVHPDDRAATLVEVDNLARGITTLRFENRYRHADGTYRHIAWTAVPGEGAIHAVGRNITSEKELAHQLTQSTEALLQSQKMEAVGQLTGGLAHDFNNMLTGISGSLEMMQSRLQQGRLQDVERYVVVAQGAARRAAALTHRLLAFSRRQTLDPKPTDVNRLTQGMHDFIQRTVGPSIPIEVVGAAGAWTVLVDPSQLENALLNLCLNARDAMPDGGRITIETANKWIDASASRTHNMPEGQYLSVAVTDTGTGMSPEIIGRVFEPFFTTKPMGEGTGLGLSMIYGFAQQSGGQVRIYSEVEQGTTICIYLPRHYGDATDEAAAAGQAAMQRSEKSETVLIVDDEPTIRMLLAEILDEMGYTALEAGDSAAGLKILQSSAHIDLLVTDVGLPGGMNGRQMADAGRVTRPDLKVLFITGYAENALLGNGHLAPGMAVLTKPFLIDAMAERIRSMIEAKS